MQFKITVEKGKIVQINGFKWISSLSAAMAEECLQGQEFPDWEHKAEQLLLELTGKVSHDIYAICRPNEPASHEYVLQILKEMEELFWRFKAKYSIPPVLADGDYDRTYFVSIRR